MNKETLKKAREILREQPRLVQHLFVEEIEGRDCFCLMGAVLHAEGAQVFSNLNRRLMFLPSPRVMTEAAALLGFSGTREAYMFNDRSTLEEAIAYLDERIGENSGESPATDEV